MRRFLTALFVLQLSTLSYAQECASSIAGLRDLVGDNGLATKWLERTSNKSRQLTLRLSNQGGAMGLDLSVPSGNWAEVSGVICKTDEPHVYVARVSSMSWGPEAPRLVKIAGKPKVITLNLKNSPNLRVTAKGMNFPFSPL